MRSGISELPKNRERRRFGHDSDTESTLPPSSSSNVWQSDMQYVVSGDCGGSTNMLMRFEDRMGRIHVPIEAETVSKVQGVCFILRDLGVIFVDV